MLFKGISYLELWQPFCSEERNHLQILVEGIQRNNLELLSGALVALLLGGEEPFMQF